MIPYLTAYDYFNIMPVESESAFDPRRDVRGNGPWRLKEFEPSVRLVWEKNPNYYVDNRPFPDTIEMPIVPDYAQRLAQFKAGEIYTDGLVIPEDVIQAKQDVPDVVIQSGQYLTGGGGYTTFGLAPGTPWHDVRMRQAVSMAIDREAFANAIDNLDVFAAQGLDLSIAYNSIVYAGWPGAYLDPTSTEFGENAKYLTYNPEEAKKLMSAAGHGSGLEFDWVYSTERYGALYLKQVDVIAGMLTEVGLMPKHLALTYSAYQDGYSEATYWNFDGVVQRAGRGWPSIQAMFSAMMLAGGTHYHGALQDGGDPAQGDPTLTDMVFGINLEFDTEAQRALIHDLIRYYTERTYSVMRPSNPKAFEVTWPVLGNYGLNTSYPGGAVTDPWLNWWIDDTKAPLA
jgi:ABC-type transport system substrate-binding protein